MTENKPYDLQLLWDKTNYGLDYFHEVYPDSVGKENKNKHFKTHNENTPSSTLSNKKSTDGVYRVFNHSTKEGFNAIDHVMNELKTTDFLEAAKYLFEKYGLSKNVPTFFAPQKSWTNDSKKPLGHWKVTPAKKHHNYKTVAPFLTDKICEEYNFVSVELFEVIKEIGESKKLSLLTVKATPEYPIFAYKFPDFAKIYEPKAVKDASGYSSKHHFLGTKPQRHIYGWDRLFEKSNLSQIEYLEKELKSADTEKEKKYLRDQINDLKLDSACICTGGSDGLNVASLGYDALWFNSEAEIISSEELHQLFKIVKVVYYIPDLDKTGVKQAVTMGLMSKKHLKIKMLWLPETLKQNNKKDIADWVRLHKNDSIEKVQNLFKQLLSQAIEFQFWEWNSHRGTYTLNNKIMLNFLKHNGFYLYKIITTTADSTNEIEETRIVQIQNNIVQVVSARRVKNFVLQWLETNFIDIKVYNMILKSVYFSETALLSLPEIELNTRTGTKDSQIYFFNNRAVKITPSSIKDYKYFEVNNLVWRSNVIDHNFTLQTPYFNIKKDESGNWTIDVLRTDSNYLKVLINTSRVFWQKDVDKNGNDANKFNIKSDNLTDEENGIQALQLINKIYVIGYLLHKYKQKSKPYFVLGIDRKIGASIKDSNGGSGKSFIVEAISCLIKNWKYKDGKEMPKENPQFIFDGVTKETDIVFMDDMVQNQDYNIIFSKTTGVIIANHKGGKIFTIPFEDAAKFVGTTNFVPNDISGSLKRRLLCYQCGDYYHEKGEDYQESRKISSDFNNKDLFDADYSTTDWNNDYNFMLQCLQFYLGQDEKIEAPEDNLIIRNLQQQIGDVQLEHCNSFFKDKTKLDVWFSRAEIQNDYNLEAGKYSKTPNAHKKGLEAFCKMNGWTLESKKIAVTDPVTQTRKSVDHYFVNTTGAMAPSTTEIIETAATTAIENEINFDEPETDLPF